MWTNEIQLWNEYEYARAYDETCITILFFAGDIIPDTAFIKLANRVMYMKNYEHIR